MICFRVCGVKLHWSVIAVIWTLAFGKSGILNTTLNFVNIEKLALNTGESNSIWKLTLTARIKTQLEVRYSQVPRQFSIQGMELLNFCHERMCWLKSFSRRGCYVNLAYTILTPMWTCCFCCCYFFLFVLSLSSPCYGRAFFLFCL